MFSIFILIFVVLMWVRDLWREALLSGSFFIRRQINIKMIMSLFIFSEVMLFFSFFLTSFNIMFNRELVLGLEWVPVGIVSFSVFKLPLLNTRLLVTSRVLLTVFHEKILKNSLSILILGGGIILGAYFFMLQVVEYFSSFFSIRDRGMGRIFFYFYRISWRTCGIWGGVFTFVIFFFLKNINNKFIVMIEIGI